MAPKKRTAKVSAAALDSGEESDGETALREVRAAEAQTQQARRGPGNASMQHFHDPVPVVDRQGAMRWEFKCRYCPKYVHA